MKGVRVLVTGAGSGIGQAVAAEALAHGARVAAFDLDPSRAPDGAVKLAADVTDDGSVVRAIAQAAAAMGGVDVVVNNAGIGAQGTVEANTIEEWQRVFDVNVFGMVRVSRAALPHLRRSDSAAIVNACSIAATAGLPERALYSAIEGCRPVADPRDGGRSPPRRDPRELREPGHRGHAVDRSASREGFGPSR